MWRTDDRVNEGTDERDLTRQRVDRRWTVRLDDVTEIDGGVEEMADGPALGHAHGLMAASLSTKKKFGIGGDPTGARGGCNEALLLEDSHVVADRRGRDTEVDDGRAVPGSDRLRGVDIVRTMARSTAKRRSRSCLPSSSGPQPALLALSLPECQLNAVRSVPFRARRVRDLPWLTVTRSLWL